MEQIRSNKTTYIYNYIYTYIYNIEDAWIDPKHKVNACIHLIGYHHKQETKRMNMSASGRYLSTLGITPQFMIIRGRDQESSALVHPQFGKCHGRSKCSHQWPLEKRSRLPAH